MESRSIAEHKGFPEAHNLEFRGHLATSF